METNAKYTGTNSLSDDDIAELYLMAYQECFEQQPENMTIGNKKRVSRKYAATVSPVAQAALEHRMRKMRGEATGHNQQYDNISKNIAPRLSHFLRSFESNRVSANIQPKRSISMQNDNTARSWQTKFNKGVRVFYEQLSIEFDRLPSDSILSFISGRPRGNFSTARSDAKKNGFNYEHVKDDDGWLVVSRPKVTTPTPMVKRDELDQEKIKAVIALFEKLGVKL